MAIDQQCTVLEAEPADDFRLGTIPPQSACTTRVKYRTHWHNSGVPRVSPLSAVLNKIPLYNVFLTSILKNGSTEIVLKVLGSVQDPYVITQPS